MDGVSSQIARPICVEAWKLRGLKVEYSSSSPSENNILGKNARSVAFSELE